MALTAFSNLHTNIYKDRVANGVVETVATAATYVFGIIADNTRNTRASVLKLWAGSAPSSVADDADMIVTLPAGEKVPIAIGEAGHQFLGGLHFACVNQDGGSVSPLHDVLITLYTD